MSYVHLKQADEKVVAVHLGDEGKNTFFSVLGGFTDKVNAADFAAKADLFDKVCALPNIEEIEGRIVYLNPSELQELLSEKENDQHSQAAE